MSVGIKTMAVLSAIGFLWGAETVHGQVRISGGMREADPYNYEWVVSNDGDELVMSFEIAHYNGHIPTVPEGWTVEMTEQAFYDKKVGVGRFRVVAAAGRAWSTSWRLAGDRA